MNFAQILAWGMPGGGELIVVLVIVLLLFGAKRLPELARSLGLAKKEFQKASREISEEIEKTKEDSSSSDKLSPSNSKDSSKKV